MTQSRRMLVLRAVVEDYIRSQEPVGSAALSKERDLGVSSATIRNDMAALEDEGYLIQPHTSAGRVPTEKGYRYFVDRLATVVPLSEAQRRGINSFLSGSVSLKDALQRSARLLSEITGQVAIVASPSLSKATLRHVELVPVAMSTLLAVVITDTGRVAQHGLTVSAMPTADDINRLSSAVNEQCNGQSLSSASETVRALGGGTGFETVREAADALADAFASMALDERANELYMSGTSHLAHSRSLTDLAPLFDALEEQVVLMKLMSNLSEEPSATGVGVSIGSESHTPELLHASVVSSGYGRSTSPVANDSERNETSPDQDGTNEPIAFVGSLGPTHMDYAATMAAVRAVARYLTFFVSESGSGD